MKKLISLLYAIIIAAAITTFVGLGSYAFYPGPQYDQTCYELNRPERPASIDDYDYTYNDKDVQSCEDIREEEKQAHAANTAIIGLAATAILVGLTIKSPLKVEEVNDGVAAGGIFTAVYTVAWATTADHRVLLFLSGTAFLVSAIITGLVKFKHKD